MMIFVIFVISSTVAQLCAPSCTSCVNGTCAECEAGYWGKYCLHTCARTCGGDGACDRDSGACASCLVGKYGQECQWPCPRGCAATAEPTTLGRGPCVVAAAPSNSTTGPANNDTAAATMPPDDDVDADRQPEPRCVFGCKIGLWSTLVPGGECAGQCSAACAASATNRTLAGGPCVDRLNCTLGCVQGKFGPGCGNECASCAPVPDNIDTCDLTGVCTDGCKAGERRFGPTCTFNCSDSCGALGCDAAGFCFDCLNSLLCGPRCENIMGCKNQTCPTGALVDCGECHASWRGPLCNIQCGTNCLRCDKRTGKCIECFSSFFGVDCATQNNACLELTQANDGTCRKCRYKSWGPRCDKDCSECDEAESIEDRDKGVCNFETGECLWGSSERAREAAALWVPISLFVFLPILIFSIAGTVSCIVTCREKRALAREAKAKEMAAIDGAAAVPTPAGAAAENDGDASA